MAYFKPYIDEAGLHIPTYNEIKAELVEQARLIYGQDIYLEHDSQDYELISLLSDKIHDTFLMGQLIYNNRGPTTAIGGALDSIVKLNGIKRKKATKSTCLVEVSGTPGTVIIGGVVADTNNINWDLETPITISQLGYSEVTAICQKFGAIYVGIGQINSIVTPTSGWNSVKNNKASVQGQEIEGQEELRARQAISTAKPSRTVIEGVIGGIAEILNVTRYRIYENDSNVVDDNTIAGHSICAVVEGGNDYEIGREIYLRKTPGCGTYGDVVVDIDIGTVYGMAKIVPIKFFRPRYYGIHVYIKIKPLFGYVSQTSNNIQENIAQYLNSLQIGEDLTVSALWGVALNAMPNLMTPQFSIISILAGIDGESMSSEDIEIPFNGVTYGNRDNIKVYIA